MADVISRPSTALVVEDELLVALHIEELLEGLGLAVVGMAARLDDALAMLTRPEPPGIAVLDVNLAGTMSWPAARQCRRRGIPFLFATGYLRDHAALPDDLSDAVLLSKPVDREALRQGIARAGGGGHA